MGRIVAVTGASGYLGGALLDRLLADPQIDHVIGIDVIEPARSHPRLLFRRMDIRDPNLAKAVDGADTVVHLAFLPATNDDHGLAHDVNRNGLANLLGAIGTTGVEHLVYPSSAMVYGAGPNTAGIDEAAPLRPPRGSYMAEEKAAAEAAIGIWRDTQKETTLSVLRLALVFGPGADSIYTGLLTSPVVLGARGPQPPFSVVHELDAASALHFAAANRLDGVYNVAADTPVSRAQLLEIAGRRQIELPLPILRLAARALARLRVLPMPAAELVFHLHPWVMANTKLRAAGWQAQHTTEDAIRATVRAHGDVIAIGPFRATRGEWRKRVLAAAGLAVAARLAYRMGPGKRRHHSRKATTSPGGVSASRTP